MSRTEAQQDTIRSFYDFNNTLKHYVVVGRAIPTASNPNPTIYKMQIFARNDVVAKSRFWYFISRMKKVKKVNGEILHLQNVTEKVYEKARVFAIWLRFTSRAGIHNMYKEFRAVSLIDAINSMYNEMASRHKAKYFSIQIIKTVELTDDEQIKRPYVRQFLEDDVKFPVIRPRVHLDRQDSRVFAFAEPSRRD